MTDEQLAAVRARCEAATPGPWTYDQMGEVVETAGDRAIALIDGAEMTDADGFFIAHARTDVPALLAHVDALAAENASLRGELATAAQIAMNLGVEVIHLDGKPDDAPVSIGQWYEPVPGWIPQFSAGIALTAADIRQAYAFYERWKHLVTPPTDDDLRRERDQEHG